VQLYGAGINCQILKEARPKVAYHYPRAQGRL